MEYSNYLTTMAQIAGVLLGFANLTSAIKKSNHSDEDIQINKIRLMVTTESGLILISSCLLPMLLAMSNLSEIEIFQLLSFSGIFTLPLVNYLNYKRTKDLTGKHFPLKASIFIFMFTILTGPVVSGLNAFAVFGVENVIFLYCCQLYLSFLFVCFMFVRLLYAVLPRKSQ